MRAAPLRFLNAALWPLTIWFSLTHLNEHPTDDYVERTSPIVATAVAFWVCAAALFFLAGQSVTAIGGGILGEGEDAVAFVRHAPGAVVGVLWFFLPVIYVVGFWLFTARDEAFPR